MAAEPEEHGGAPGPFGETQQQRFVHTLNNFLAAREEFEREMKQLIKVYYPDETTLLHKDSKQFIHSLLLKTSCFSPDDRAFVAKVEIMDSSERAKAKATARWKSIRRVLSEHFNLIVKTVFPPPVSDAPEALSGELSLLRIDRLTEGD